MLYSTDVLLLMCASTDVCVLIEYRLEYYCMHETVVVVGMAVLTRLWSVHMFSSLRRKVFTVEGYCGGVVCVAVCGGCGLRPEAEAGDSATHRHFPRVLQREREGTQAATGEVRRKGGQVKEGEGGEGREGR